MKTDERIPAKHLGQKELKQFFISHLSRIYCAKTQLSDKLPELEKRARFLDLRQAIGETTEIVNLQISRMRDIFIRLDDFYRPESCTGLIGILDEAFQSVGVFGESPVLSDLSLLFYMQNIESIEVTSFNILMFVAGKLEREDVVQLLRECFDEAREDQVLLKAITANYL